MDSLACGLAITLAALGGGSSAPRPPEHGMETVIQDDALLLYRSAADVRRIAQRIAQLGADRVRLTASWNALAAHAGERRKPRFDATDSRDYPHEGFARLDRAVKEVRRAGMETMIDLAFFAPRWAAKRSSPDGRDVWQPSSREFRLFSRAVAERYSGRFTDPADRRRKLPAVRLWTTWNEPNNSVFLMPQWQRPAARRGRPRPERRRRARRAASGQRRRPSRTWQPASPHVYRRLHNAAYDQLKATSRENKVLIGGLAAEPKPGKGASRGIGPLRFTRELACVDDSLRRLRRRECRGFRALRADGFAHHPYSLSTPPSARDPGLDRVQIGELDRLTELLEALYLRGRLMRRLPLYLTEYGYETKPPDPRGQTPEDHARYLGEATFLAWQRPEVRMFAQFLLQDIGPDRRAPEGSPSRWADYQTGLYHDDGRPKRGVVQAFRFPFFAELVEDEHGSLYTVAFGQVRPRAGPQRVLIQRRVAPGRWLVEASLRLLGGTGPNLACGEFTTDDQGFFQRRLPFRGPGVYRAVWRASSALVQYSQEILISQPRRVLGGVDSLTRGSG